MQLQFGVQSYQHRSLPVSAQRMVNCYLEQPPQAGKQSSPVVQSYGIEEWTTVGEGPLRGGLIVNNVPYIVSGNQLYRLQSTGASSSLGSIPGQSPVDMTSDGTNVLVVAAPVGHLYNGFTLAPIADTDFPGAQVCEQIETYAVIVEPQSGRAWINEIQGDWSTWNALDYRTAAGWPDDILDALTQHKELVLFGRETTETWYYSGAADFPLEPVASGFIEKGILSTGSAAKHDNTVFFPGHDGVVYRLDGFTPVRISTHAIEQAIESYADKTCRGITWTEAGHAFYALTFNERTWIYDISSGMWHERQSYGLQNWRVLQILRVFDKWLALDATFEQDWDPDRESIHGVGRSTAERRNITDRKRRQSVDVSRTFRARIRARRRHTVRARCRSASDVAMVGR